MTGTSPSISFVVRLHNAARFAAAAVASALAQRHPGLEVLVVDDASTDDSAAIATRLIAAYKGPHRARLLRLEHNRGCGGALQAAAEAASGEVVVLADGDDLSDPDRAAQVGAAFAADPTLLLVAHGQRAIDAKGQPIAERAVTAAPPTLIAAAAFGQGIAGAVSAYRRRLLEGLSPLDGLMHSEDWLLTVRALALGRVAVLPRVLVSRRSHAGNVSGPTAELAAARAYQAWGLKHDRAAFAAYARLSADLPRLPAAARPVLDEALARGLRRLRLRRAAARVPLRRLPALARALGGLGLGRRSVWRDLARLRWPGFMLHQGRFGAMRRAILADVAQQKAERREP